MSPEAAAPDGRRRSPAGDGGLRVGVDVRLADGRSGAVSSRSSSGWRAGYWGFATGTRSTSSWHTGKTEGGPSRTCMGLSDLWLDQSAEPVTSPFPWAAPPST